MKAAGTAENLVAGRSRSLLDRVERVQQTAREAIDALESAIRALEIAHDELTNGVAPVAAVEAMLARGGTTTRVRASHALTRYSAAAMALRAEVVRLLVEDAGLTVTDVARKMGVSRQLAARLYQAAQRRDKGGEPPTPPPRAGLRRGPNP